MLEIQKTIASMLQLPWTLTRGLNADALGRPGERRNSHVSQTERLWKWTVPGTSVSLQGHWLQATNSVCF
ncbi:hypothetical protein LEMLEM_LOCUS14226 [Lemmus lemmus]